MSRKSADSEGDLAQLSLEMQDRPNPLPEAQGQQRPKTVHRNTVASTSASLTAPLLDDVHNSLGPPLDPNSKYRPEVTDDRVHTSTAQYRCVDYVYFSTFLLCLYAALLALLYALLTATEKDTHVTGGGCLAVCVLLGACLIGVILRGEIKHYYARRHAAQAKFPATH